jgi:phosphate-selective porin OprO/OprP
VSLANGRPTFATADGQFTASLRGVLQLDAAQYIQQAPGPLSTDPRRGSFNDAIENEHARDLNDGANFRRARIGIEGKAFGDFEYNFLYDFGGSGVEEAGKISAAWVQYNGLGPVRIRVGAFSPPAGLEEAVSTNGSLFAERASPSELVRGIASGDGRTAAGVFSNGERWQFSAAFTGNVIGTQTYDEQLGFVGRFSLVPFKREASLVHLGVNTSIVINPAATGPDVSPGVGTPLRLRDRPELRVDGTRLVDTGNIDADGLTAWGLEFGAQHRNLYVQAEYFDIRVQRRVSLLADPHFSGWYAQAGWTLTGEPRRYAAANGVFDSPRPVKPFNVRKGNWGAWELAVRYSDLDLNYRAGSAGSAPGADAIRGGEQKILSVGLNWYLNNVLRLQAAFPDVSVDRLSPGGAAFGAGATPAAGIQVGQDLQIWSLRTQYAF